MLKKIVVLFIKNINCFLSVKLLTLPMPKEHLLEYVWVWSYKNPEVIDSTTNSTSSEWISDFDPIYKVNTIEMFWRVYNNIPRIYQTPVGFLYSFFRESIEPCWEHPKNKKGCRYMINLSGKQFDAIEQLEQEILLFLIGNESEYHSDINGCTMSVKPRFWRVSIWLSQPTESERTKKLIEELEKKIDLEKHKENKQNRIVIHCLSNEQSSEQNVRPSNQSRKQSSQRSSKANYRTKKRNNRQNR